MALTKRGGIYWYDFHFNGERYQETTKTGNKRAAEQIQAKAKTDLALGIYGLTPLRPGPPLRIYAEQFKAHVLVRNKAHPETVRYYLEKLTRLLEYKPLADCRIHLIDETVIEGYITYRRPKVRKVGTLNRELATLRRILYVAMDTHKLIVRVPKIVLLQGEVAREYVLSQDLEKIYLAVVEDTLRDFAILSLDTGVRDGEGLRLEWADVYFEPAQGARLGYIHIREGGRKKRNRQLSISPRLKAMLENRRLFYPKARFVFPSPRKKDRPILVTSLDHQHARTRAKAKDDQGKPIFGKDFVIHSLRHTFATRLGESGADAFRIMKIMGHSSITISEKYVHPTPDLMERAFESLDAMNEILRGSTEAADRLGVPTISTKKES